MQHHPLGPSVYARRKACPGSFHLENQLPETQSPESERGTILHEELARALATGTTPTTPDVRRVFEALTRWISPGDDLHIEQPIEIEYQGEKLWGTPDLVIYSKESPDYVTVFDAKFARSRFQARDQLRLYAAMALRASGRKIAIAVAYWPALAVEETVSVNSEEADGILWEWYTLLQLLREETSKSDYRPGPYCEWCRGALSAKCPAVRRELEVFSEPGPLDTVKLAYLLDRARVIEKIIAELKEEAKRLLLKGERVPGYTLRQRSAPGFLSLQELREILGPRFEEWINHARDVSESQLRAQLKEFMSEDEVELLWREQIAPKIRRGNPVNMLVRIGQEDADAGNR